MDFELGRTYAGYKFLDVVHRSRSVVQYRVQNTIAQRVESLQTLPSAATDDQDASERFLREVRVRARLTHPHVVSFYTAMPVEGRMVMTTELYEGLPLAERLELGPLPWRVALRVACQILDVLTFLHQQSIVHCDITPENILFGPEEFCKVSSFALARPLGAAHAPESGAVVGNPKYISPEQVKGGRELDQRSDLYSVGAVLYEMLCGRPPFESRSQFELMLAHVNQAPVPPSEVNREVPDFLDALVLRGLAKEPADRYQSAQDFSAALEAAESAEETEALTEALTEAAAEAAAVVEAIAVVEGGAEPVVEAAVEDEVPQSEPRPSGSDIPAPGVEPVIVAETEAPVVEAVAELEVPPVVTVEAAAPVVEAVAELEVPPVAVAAIAEPVVEAVAELDAEPVAVAAIAEPVVEVVAELEVPPVVAVEAAEPVVEVVAELEAEPVAVAAITEPVVEAVAELEVPLVALAEVAEPVVEVVAELEAEPVAIAAIAEPVVEVVAELEAEPVAVAAIAEPVVEVVAEVEVVPVAIAAVAEPVVEAVAELKVPPVAVAPAAPAAPAVPVGVVALAIIPPAAPQPKLKAAAAAAGGSLPSTLWSAATLVAASASAPAPAAFVPPLPATVQLAGHSPAVPAATAVGSSATAAAPPAVAPAPALAPTIPPDAVPGLVASIRKAPDAMQWFFFGGTAAFLGVVWVAIWLAAGK